MRMIDADKFKEDLLKLWDYSTVDGITATTVIKQVISDLDNCPTVAVNCKDCDGYEAGYSAGLKDAERPQGEWIYTEKTDKEKGYGGYCSNCKCDMPIFVEDWKQKYCETNFCPNCGAKMK